MYLNTVKLPFIGLFILVFFSACKEESTPKPDAFLTLEYPKQEYIDYHNPKTEFSFDVNQWATVKEMKSNSFEVHYPSMKATLFFNYKPVENNLDILFKDAQKLTYEHFIKADEIIEHPFINDGNKVYGMLYNIQGDAATNIQFYATDSVKNFLVGSLYFYAKPNFDSILPAKEYIEKDMRRILETLKWKEK